jgi:hypothetical protein
MRTAVYLGCGRLQRGERGEPAGEQSSTLSQGLDGRVSWRLIHLTFSSRERSSVHLVLVTIDPKAF